MFKVRDGFQVWTSPLGTVLVGLESRRLEACLKFAIDMSADGVVLSRYHGFAEAKLECLLKWRSIKSLYIVDDWPDLSPVEQLADLEWLQLGGSSSAQAFRLAPLQKLKVLRAKWWPRLMLEDSSPPLLDLYLSDFRPSSRDCSALRSLRNLRRLEFSGSNIRSFNGLEAVKKLEDLVAIDCRALRDTSALRSCGGSLKHLSLGHCRKIDPVLDVRTLANLVSLSYYACADIPSLRFVEDLPNLTHLRFLKTKILDGDLSAVLHLVDVNFESARGLSHTCDEVRQIIATRLS